MQQPDVNVWNSTFKKGPGELIKLYTDDARIYPERMEPVSGKRDIQAFWEQDFQTGDESVAQSGEQFDLGSGYVLEVGDYSYKHEGSKVRGNYMTLFKKEGTEWRIHRQMWHHRHD